MSTEETNVQFGESKTQSVRLNPNDRAALARVIDNSDEWGNASAAIRGLIRDADEQADPDGGPALTEGRVPPGDDDLAEAWELLKGLTNGGDGWIRRDRAISLIAQSLAISKEAVYGTVLRRLEKRGYVRISCDATGQNTSIRVRK